MTTKLPPLSAVLDLIPDAVCIVDAEGRFLFVSAGFERIFGYAPREVLGRRAFDLVHPDDREATVQQAQRIMAGGFQRHFRNRYIHKAGHSVDVLWSAHWLPEFGVRIGVAREVGELRRAERELEFRADHDPLTGLPNRHCLQRELQGATTHAARRNDSVAVLYIDLDGFKAVNDRGGHDAGDRVLREVAQRLLLGVRQGDLVARIGGDEFVVLLPGCGRADASQIAEGLRAGLRHPFPAPDAGVQVDASIGIACFPADGRTPEALLAHADRAMYAIRRERARQGQPRIGEVGEVHEIAK